MAKLRRKKISHRTVEALTVEKDTVFWDSELLGFGVRVYPTGSKFYVVQTRARGRPGKRVTVGRHGVITPTEARRRAALVIARIKSGEEPAPERIGDPAPAQCAPKPPPCPDDVSWEMARDSAVRISDSIASDILNGWEERSG